MFTGIVQLAHIARIVTDAQASNTHITITAPNVADTIGQSIAVNGICLTVTAFTANDFTVTLSPETLRCTNAHTWAEGDGVNIESALTLSSRMDGHMVSGHVDGVARIISITPHGANSAWVMEAPAPLSKYIAVKGSVTLDGISLTVNQVEGNQFSVMLIPHTLAVTSFSAKKAGDAVNIEVDMLARYVERLLQGAA